MVVLLLNKGTIHVNISEYRIFVDDERGILDYVDGCHCTHLRRYGISMSSFLVSVSMLIPTQGVNGHKYH